MPVTDDAPAKTERHNAHDRDEDPTRLHRIAEGARREVGSTLESVRAAGSDVGERMPELVETVRSGAMDGARTLQSWPEPTQRMLAVFSLGLGAGLMLAGAPRLVVGGSIVPALVVAASTLGRDANLGRRRA